MKFKLSDNARHNLKLVMIFLGKLGFFLLTAFVRLVSRSSNGAIGFNETLKDEKRREENKKFRPPGS